MSASAMRAVYWRRRLRNMCVRCADPTDGRSLCYECHRYQEVQRRGAERVNRCGSCGEVGHNRLRCTASEGVRL